MKMSKMKKVFISILAIVAICCSIMSFTVFASGEATLKNESQLNFTFGQQITRPTGQLECDGVTKDADVSVKYPDGKISTSNIMVLDVEGVYTVYYSAIFTDGEKTVTRTFSVEKPLYYTSKADSTVEYGTYYYAEHDKGAGYKGDKEDAVKMRNSSVSGLMVSLAQGDVFQYSRMINLNGLTKDKNILKMIITPEEIGAKDVDEFSIILTDAHDPSNYLTFQFIHPDSTNSYGYFKSGAPNQPLTGFNWNSWEGGEKGKYMNANAGTVTGFGLAGPNETTRFGPVRYDSKLAHPIDEIADNGFSLSADYSEKAFYNTMSTYVNANSKTFLGQGKNDMIIDFNDPRMFDTLWKGFSTGECFLSIKSGSYQGSSFNFVITEIIDQDADVSDQLKNTEAELKDMSFDKRGELNININLGDYSANDLPKGIVSMDYPILSATCENAYYGSLDVIPTVKDPSGNPVAVNDNSFVPTVAGVYTITYNVSDYRGVTNTKNVSVEVVESLADVDVEIAGTGYLTSSVAGKWVEIADETAVNGSGVLTISYQVTLNDKPVQVEGKEFFASKSGTYEVKIIATDYLGRFDTVSYQVEIANGDKPVYLDSPIMPKYFISGKTYELPLVKAYDYTSGDGNYKEIISKIAYRDTYGLKSAIGRSITPVVDDIDTTIDIIYYTESPTAEGNLVFEDLRIVNINDNSGKANRYDFAKLLVGENFSVKKETAHSTLSFDQDIYFDYVNSLIAEGLSVDFRGVDGMANYNEIVLTYTDSENADEEIKFFFTPDSTGSKTYVYLNSYNTIPYEISQSIVNSKESLEFVIFPESKSYKYDKYSASQPTIETYFNGEAFEGFTTSKVYVRMEINGVQAESAIDILAIGGQQIATGSRDNDSPKFAISGSYLGYKDFGTQARIPKTIFADTIDPSVKGTVTVYAPENKNGVKTIVSSIDGIYLKNVPCDRDYFIQLNLYGNYEVVFTAMDDAGNELDPMSNFYRIGVLDLVAPEITLNSKAPTSGKVGSKITIPSATAVDKVSGSCKVSMFLTTSKGVKYYLGSKRAFIPNEKGLYEVSYVAIDANNNMAVKTITINVK